MSFQPAIATSTVSSGQGHRTPASAGGQGPSLSPEKKFVLELNEQGNTLQGQTRKFVLYFSETVTAHVHQSTNTISFSPTSGGIYNGIMQLGYIGTGPRGNHANSTVYDKYVGVYSDKPKTSFCISESSKKAFTTFHWNINNQFAATPLSPLFMLAMPHHVRINSKLSRLSYFILQKNEA